MIPETIIRARKVRIPGISTQAMVDKAKALALLETGNPAAPSLDIQVLSGIPSRLAQQEAIKLFANNALQRL